MRLLYLAHQYFPRHVGGTEVYLRGLARRARARGDRALVITYHECPSGNPADYGPRRTEHDGIPLVEMHYNLSVTPNPARFEYDHPVIGRAVAEEPALAAELEEKMDAWKARLERCAQPQTS
jgi:hypothetical protein